MKKMLIEFIVILAGCLVGQMIGKRIDLCLDSHKR
jgi:hypothetical protein